MSQNLRKIIFVIQIIFLSPIILFIIVIWPILRIKIGEIKSRAFGSIVLTPEVYLIEKKFGLYKKNDIFLWYHQKNVANKYLLDKRKKDLIFLPGIILYPIKLFFSKFRFTHKHLYYKFFFNEKIKKFSCISDKCRTNQELLKKSDPFVKFSQEEIEKGNKYLEKYLINKDDNVVLFGSRSGIYKDEKLISIRNSNITKQINAIKFVTDNGYKAIRVGRDRVNKINIDSKNFFDYTFSGDQSDFLDIFIASKAKFMVCGTTGLMSLGTLMRFPNLMIDFCKFGDLCGQNETYNPILVPKKIFSKNLKRYLTYKEIFEKKIFEVNNVSQIPKNFLLIDNSEDEILSATKEMIQLVDKRSLNLDYEINNQKDFWKIHSKYYKFTKGIIISPSFYKKFNYLFV